MTVKTTFNGASPWAGLTSTTHLTARDPAPPRKKPPQAPTLKKQAMKTTTAPKKTSPSSGMQLPPGVLAVTTETLIVRTLPGRFDGWFDTLKVGDCIQTQMEITESIKGYLDRYIKTHGKPWKSTRSMAQPDGIGRIWIAAR